MSEKNIAKLKEYFDDKPLPECPNCGTNEHAIRCFYGKPGPDLIAYVEAGNGILMGCMAMPGERKIGKCKQCDEFIAE